MLQSLDRVLLDWLIPLETPWLDALMRGASAAGRGGLVWIVLGLLAFVRARNRAAVWRLVLAVLLAYALVDLALKPLVARPRPAIQPAAATRSLPPLPSSSSFPSGHAAAAVAAAVAIGRLWPRGRGLWWALAGLIAYSRLYLGHHYPLDVLGGAIVGAGVAMWVLGGRHPATYARTLPDPLPRDLIVRP